MPWVLLDRWYLVLIGLLATGGLVVTALHLVPPSYTTKANVLLLPPPTSVPAGGNPYLSLGGLDAAADIVSKSLSVDSMRNSLKEGGALGEWTVELDSTAAAPLILVTVDAETPDSSRKTLGLVLQQIPEVLQRVQQAVNAPTNAYIRSSVITSTEQPVRGVKPVIRAVGVVAAGGLLATIFGTTLVDSFLARRRRRQRGRVAHRGRSRPNASLRRTPQPAAQIGRRAEPGGHATAMVDTAARGKSSARSSRLSALR
jgi:hypothetical protein